MHGNPAAASYAHRAQLALISFLGSYPDPGTLVEAACLDSKISTSPNNDFFQIAQVAVDVGIETVEVKDRIPTICPGP